MGTGVSEKSKTLFIQPESSNKSLLNAFNGTVKVTKIVKD